MLVEDRKEYGFASVPDAATAGEESNSELSEAELISDCRNPLSKPKPTRAGPPRQTLRVLAGKGPWRFDPSQPQQGVQASLCISRRERGTSEQRGGVRTGASRASRHPHAPGLAPGSRRVRCPQPQAEKGGTRRPRS